MAAAINRAATDVPRGSRTCIDLVEYRLALCVRALKDQSIRCFVSCPLMRYHADRAIRADVKTQQPRVSLLYALVARSASVGGALIAAKDKGYCYTREDALPEPGV